MALGRRKREKQLAMWVAADEIARGPGNPFYVALNAMLAERGFDPHVERLCEKFYSNLGRPGVPPGVYFRMLLIGFFEGEASERRIDWRCQDSLTFREFLGYAMTQATPDHSTLSTIRRRIDVETHHEVFAWVLAGVSEAGLLSGKTVGIDATLLKANAAMRSIVRRDTGASYQQFLIDLAQASGIETPTREDLIKLDKTRKNKASNDDWVSPSDPDSRIAKMKDGSTHLAHKVEHATDLGPDGHGAILAVTLHPGDEGDCESIVETHEELVEVALDVREQGGEMSTPKEIVTDKGYHSNDSCVELKDRDVRTYISEPDRGERTWTDKKTGEVNTEARDAVYANRRRIKGERGKQLLKRRGEFSERPFAHLYETGAMRRIYLRGHPNILKRLLIHAAGFNLGLIMRHTFGVGKPRALQDGLTGVTAAFRAVVDGIFDRFFPIFGLLRARWSLQRVLRPLGTLRTTIWPKFPPSHHHHAAA